MTQYSAEVKTYATFGNLGPLFDRGAGKDGKLFMLTRGELSTIPELRITSQGKYPVSTDETNLAHKVAGKIFQDYGIKDGLVLNIINDIKPGGLGTSAAGAVAVVELINYLYDLKLTPEQKIRYAAFGEPDQHLDNVAACVIGGIVLSAKLEGRELPRYSKLRVPSDLIPAVVIPLDIEKTGGTARAKETIKDLSLTIQESVYASGLAELMIAGIIENDFEKIRESVAAYSRWPKSVTWVRNKAGVYVVDVEALTQGLEDIVGEEAILTPSGAGTAMLILAKNPEVAQKALDTVIRMYNMMGHRTDGMVTSFNEAESKDSITPTR